MKILLVYMVTLLCWLVMNKEVINRCIVAKIKQQVGGIFSTGKLIAVHKHGIYSLFVSFFQSPPLHNIIK